MKKLILIALLALAIVGCAPKKTPAQKAQERAARLVESPSFKATETARKANQPISVTYEITGTARVVSLTWENDNIYYYEYPGSFQFEEQRKSLVVALEADGYSECQIVQHPYNPYDFIAPSDVPFTLFWGCEDTTVNWRIGIEEPNKATLIVVLDD